eukprot:5002285-Heterocapsa_arctica.AAC.1
MAETKKQRSLDREFLLSRPGSRPNLAANELRNCKCVILGDSGCKSYHTTQSKTAWNMDRIMKISHLDVPWPNLECYASSGLTHDSWIERLETFKQAN